MLLIRPLLHTASKVQFTLLGLLEDIYVHLHTSRFSLLKLLLAYKYCTNLASSFLPSSVLVHSILNNKHLSSHLLLLLSPVKLPTWYQSAGEGAMPPQLPAPATHAELCNRLRQPIRSGSLLRIGVTMFIVGGSRGFKASKQDSLALLRQPIRRGSSLRRGVDSPFNLSTVLFFQSSVSRSRFVNILSKALINLFFVVFNRSRVLISSWSRVLITLFTHFFTIFDRSRSVNGVFVVFDRYSWSRSSESMSAVLINTLSVVISVNTSAPGYGEGSFAKVFDPMFEVFSRSRFVKVLSRVLISHLFTAFNPCSRRRSTEISSRVLVNPIVSVFDRNSGSSESSSAELVGPSPVAIPGADPWKARAMCSLIINDSWSRSMDSWSRVTVAVSSPQRRTRKEKQQAPSQPKTAGDDGGALSKLSPTLKSAVSDSSDSLLLMSGTEDRVVAPLLVFFMLVTKPPKFGGSFKKIEGSRKVEHSNLKKVDNASEVDCIRTLEVFSLSILIWKWIIKLWHFQDLRKRIADNVFEEMPNRKRHWGMHSVDFYNCWNAYQQESSTQIFILSDKPKDAILILVGFRGTESLDVDDWSFADQDIDGRALMLFLLKHKGSNQINFEIGWPCYCWSSNIKHRCCLSGRNFC